MFVELSNLKPEEINYRANVSLDNPSIILRLCGSSLRIHVGMFVSFLSELAPNPPASKEWQRFVPNLLKAQIRC